MRVIRRLLVANRGEIACRVIRTCHRMGIEAVAVFSDADADAPHVRMADLAARLGPAPARESYLHIERLIAAAQATGADAVHPGYGFLSERAPFARAVEAAGLTWVGPSPEVIEAMGSKIEAKSRAMAAGVPVVPGALVEAQDGASLREAALEVGFPLLLKASAGGGGKGMRIVRDAAALDEAIAAARREAEGAFGDGALLIERYIQRPRHIEIQILGDQHGNIVHLFERECSIQRRHQKIIEEAPSAALDDAQRAAMGAAAVALGRSIGYTSAGTVEFIVDEGGAFYFLEVNTRLQVEHPVTEETVGLDLVGEQLRVAQGEALGYTQEALRQTGAAIECRLYAEDSAAGFLPSTGRLADFHWAGGEGLRLDAGVEAGAEIGVHYDPMLAKVIARGATRAEATRRLVLALRRMAVSGVRTNQELLLRVLEHPAWASGALSTHFIEEHREALLGASPQAEAWAARALVAATLAGHEARRASQPHLPHLEPGFRNNFVRPQEARWRRGEAEVRVRHRNLGGGRLEVGVGEASASVYRVVRWAAPELRWEDAAGVVRAARVVWDGPRCFVHEATGGASVELELLPRFPEPGAGEVAGGLVAPMPGQVLQVRASAGDVVEAGQVLVVLEAMKMEQPVLAPEAGVVEEVRVSVGDQVEVGAVLVVVASGGR